MRPYLERLSKIRTEMDNLLLSMLMEDYIYFISDLVDQTNIMSKEFYIIVPFYPDESAQKIIEQTKSSLSKLMDRESNHKEVIINEQDLEKAKTELKNRVQNVVNGLIQVGINSSPLSTEELIQLLYNTYNPDTASRQTLGSITDLQSPLITKGEGSVVQDHLIMESDR